MQGMSNSVQSPDALLQESMQSFTIHQTSLHQNRNIKPGGHDAHFLQTSHSTKETAEEC